MTNETRFIRKSLIYHHMKFIFLLILLISFGITIDNVFADHLEIIIIPDIGSADFTDNCTNFEYGCYTPGTAQIDIGGKIIFSNTDSASHTFSAGTAADGPSGEFDSGMIMAGNSYEWIANKEGEIPYFCMVHPWMNGIILVGDVSKNQTQESNSKCGAGTIFDTKINACILIPDEEPKTKLAAFVDENKDPWSYVDRYKNESSYKEWFDDNYLEYPSIYEAVGLKTPLDFVDTSKAPKYYFDRYINEPSYRDWFDSNYPDYTISEAIGVPESIFNEILQSQNESISKPIITEQIKLDKKILSSSQQQEYDIYLHKAKAFGVFRYIPQSMSYYDKALALTYSKEVEEEKNIVWKSGNIFPTATGNNLSDALQGMNYLQKREFDKAFQVCSTGLKINSEDFPSFMCKLASALNLEKYDEVLKLYKFYPHLASTSLESSNLVGISLLSGTYTPPKFVAYYQLGQYDLMIENADLLSNIVDSRYKTAFLLPKAVALEKQGKGDVADLVYKQLVNQGFTSLFGGYSQEWDMNIVRGYSYLAFRDYDVAIDYLEKSTSDNPYASYAKVIAYYELEKQPPTKQIEKIIPSKTGGGCLIATATYGSELASEVQKLRELRDNSLLGTESGTSFMGLFNDVYYSFSPVVADYERENPVFKEMVKITITPMITSLSILNYVDMDSEVEVLGYGISLIILNGMMYVGIPAIFLIGIRKRF